MNEFISEFGKENFIILIAIVGVIVLALIVIVLIEKIQTKAKLKKQIRNQISNIKSVSNNFEDQNIRKKDQIEVLEENSINNNEKDIIKDEVVYVEAVNPKLEAKEKLEEVTKKLIEKDNNLIDHTHFETEQEEKSIISYEELVKVSHEIDEKNDKLLEDEGEAAITLEELYQKHVEDQNQIEESKNDVRVNNPVFDEEEPKKFKNSEVISPVFGFYSGKTKQEEIKSKELFEEIDKNIGTKDLEDEIQRTEDFLSELKRLKNKLD